MQNKAIIENIWNVINQPISVLIIGSAIGWIFINLVWEPYKDRQREKDQVGNYKKEVNLRLSELEMYFDRKWFGSGIVNLIDGMISLNPDFKSYKLTTLIYSGWNEEVYEKTFRDIGNLQELGFVNESITETEKVEKAKKIISKIKQCLKDKN